MITAEQIKAKLLSDQKWLEKGIMAIYQKQTANEKATETTNVHNKVGFSAFDAKQGTYMATWLLKGNHLSGKFVPKAQKMMVKYAGQLERIANEAETARGREIYLQTS